LQSLLVYLLLHRGVPQSRQHLAFLFWPDLPEDRARNNLRQALHLLRQILPSVNRFLETDTLIVYWRMDSPFRLDVAEFEQRLVAAGAAEHAGNLGAFRSALERALPILGQLLPSCYEDWILSERERLHQKCLAGLERIILLLEGQRDYSTAIRYAQQLIRHDPLYENGYRMLMRLYALNNDRASALRTYQTCAGVLQRELGVEPERLPADLRPPVDRVRLPGRRKTLSGTLRWLAGVMFGRSRPRGGKAAGNPQISPDGHMRRKKVRQAKSCPKGNR
jgi:DNA-binding SARP family transcriptional activator